MFPDIKAFSKHDIIEVDLSRFGLNFKAQLRISRNCSEILLAGGKGDHNEHAEHYSTTLGQPVAPRTVIEANMLEAFYVGPEIEGRGGLPTKDDFIRFSIEHGNAFIALVEALNKTDKVAPLESEAVENFTEKDDDTAA